MATCHSLSAFFPAGDLPRLDAFLACPREQVELADQVEQAGGTSPRRPARPSPAGPLRSRERRHRCWTSRYRPAPAGWAPATPGRSSCFMAKAVAWLRTVSKPRLVIAARRVRHLAAGLVEGRGIRQLQQPGPASAGSLAASLTTSLAATPGSPSARWMRATTSGNPGSSMRSEFSSRARPLTICAASMVDAGMASPAGAVALCRLPAAAM
jgi:hypothetical protein